LHDRLFNDRNVFFIPGSPNGLDWHGLQQVDLPLQVKVGGVMSGNKGPGGAPGHVQILNKIARLYYKTVLEMRIRLCNVVFYYLIDGVKLVRNAPVQHHIFRHMGRGHRGGLKHRTCHK
jgi:hypothetical protein